MLPKVSKLLRSESHALAGIYPRLLPLVHKIPQSDLDSGLYFDDLLPAIRSGMKTFVIGARGHHQNSSSSCQSGGSACVMAFFEVATYGLKSGTNGEEAILQHVS